MEMKKCSKCKIKKELNYFCNHSYTKDGKQYTCKDCNNIHKRKQYTKLTGRTEEQILKHKYLGKIIDGKKLCSKCNEWKNVENFCKSYMIKCELQSHCKECQLWCDRVRHNVLRMEFLIAYGGKCVCCGETGIEFLTLEHVREHKVQLIYIPIRLTQV